MDSGPRARANFFSIYGAIGLTIAVVVHVGSYVGQTISPSNPLFYIMHAGIFPLFFAFVIRAAAWQGSARGVRQRQLRWREQLRYIPRWVTTAEGVLAVYVLVNFLVSISHLPPKGSHAAMTPSDALYTVRAFSGHWLIFYALPTTFFAYVPANTRPVESAQDTPA